MLCWLLHLLVCSEPQNQPGTQTLAVVKTFTGVMGGEGIPVVSLGEPHANTEQQIMSQEEAEKLSTELQCSLK